MPYCMDPGIPAKHREPICVVSINVIPISDGVISMEYPCSLDCIADVVMFPVDYDPTRIVPADQYVLTSSRISAF